MTLKRTRSELVLRGPPRLARLVSRHGVEPAWLPWLRGHVTTRSRILDVGCGAGHFLLELRGQGFRNLTGADASSPTPFGTRTGSRFINASSKT